MRRDYKGRNNPNCKYPTLDDYFFSQILNYQYVVYPSICFQNKNPAMYTAFAEKLYINMDFTTVNRCFDHISFWFLPILIIICLFFLVSNINK